MDEVRRGLRFQTPGEEGDGWSVAELGVSRDVERAAMAKDNLATATARLLCRIDAVPTPQLPQPGDQVGFRGCAVAPLVVPHGDVFG
jgi:hypothetical protein